MNDGSSMHEELALLKERQQRLELQHEQLWHQVWGNGRAGLRDDVAEIKRWMLAMRKWLGLIAAVLLTQVLGGLSALLWLVIQQAARK